MENFNENPQNLLLFLRSQCPLFQSEIGESLPNTPIQTPIYRYLRTGESNNRNNRTKNFRESTNLNQSNISEHSNNASSNSNLLSFDSTPKSSKSAASPRKLGFLHSRSGNRAGQKSRKSLTLGEFFVSAKKQSSSDLRPKCQSTPQSELNSSFSENQGIFASFASSTANNSGFCDDFPSLESASVQKSSKNSRRRITPTPIRNESPKKQAGSPRKQFSKENSENFLKSRSYKTRQPGAKNLFETVTEIPLKSSENVVDERALIMEKRQSMQVPGPVTTSKSSTLSGMMRQESLEKPGPTTPGRTFSSSQSSVEADPDFVTFSEILVELSRRYAGVLRNFGLEVGLNLLKELQFIFRLLLVPKIVPIDEDLLLGTVHNCVYFACEVLSQITDLLDNFGAEILSLLLENVRFRAFTDKNTVDSLNQSVIHLDRVSLAGGSSIAIGDSANDLNLSFSSNECTRKVFPDQTSFHSFKKQRDQFFEIWRNWSDLRMFPERFSRQKFTNQVHLLIKMGSHTINYALLAQLFLQHLLKEGDCTPIRKSEFDAEALSQLENADPDRIKRLTERMNSSSAETEKLQEKPGFPGNQKFFKEFLLAADSATFTKILKNLLLSSVQKLNNVAWKSMEEERGITDRLNQCKLLAKFLGYMEFLPYQQLKSIPEHLRNDMMNSRNHSTVVDMILVTEKFEWFQLCWVTQLLSMADSMFVDTKEGKILVRELLGILSAAKSSLFSSRNNGVQAAFLTCMTLSWLFSLPQFRRSTLSTAESQVKTENSSKNMTRGQTCNQTLDRGISTQIESLPFIRNLRIELRQFALLSTNCSQTPSSVRKIKPIRLDSSLNQESKINSEKMQTERLRKELKVQFLSQQPDIVKKCIDVCAECLANQRATEVKAHWMGALKERLKHNQEDLDVSEVCEEMVRNQIASSNSHERLAKSVLPLMESLLSNQDIGLAVIKMAAEISGRQAENRFHSWLKMSLTKEWLICESHCLVKHSSSPEVENNSLDYCSALNAFSDMREALLIIESRTGSVEEGKIAQLISKCQIISEKNISGLPMSAQQMFHSCLQELRQSKKLMGT